MGHSNSASRSVRGGAARGGAAAPAAAPAARARGRGRRRRLARLEGASRSSSLSSLSSLAASLAASARHARVARGAAAAAAAGPRGDACFRPRAPRRRRAALRPRRRAARVEQVGLGEELGLRAVRADRAHAVGTDAEQRATNATSSRRAAPRAPAPPRPGPRATTPGARGPRAPATCIRVPRIWRATRQPGGAPGRLAAITRARPRTGTGRTRRTCAKRLDPVAPVRGSTARGRPRAARSVRAPGARGRAPGRRAARASARAARTRGSTRTRPPLGPRERGGVVVDALGSVVVGSLECSHSSCASSRSSARTSAAHARARALARQLQFASAGVTSTPPGSSPRAPRAPRVGANRPTASRRAVDRRVAATALR